MQFIYPAVFSQNEDGTYKGYFPDLEQCFAKGDTINEVLNSAIEEARTWIQVELEDTFAFQEFEWLINRVFSNNK